MTLKEYLLKRFTDYYEVKDSRDKLLQDVDILTSKEYDYRYMEVTYKHQLRRDIERLSFYNDKPVRLKGVLGYIN